jgi:hypothetical protein
LLKSIQKLLHNNFMKKYGFGWLYRDFFLHAPTFLATYCMCTLSLLIRWQYDKTIKENSKTPTNDQGTLRKNQRMYRHGMCFRASSVFVLSILFWFPQCTHYFWRVFRFLFLEHKQDCSVTSVKDVKVCF